MNKWAKVLLGIVIAMAGLFILKVVVSLLIGLTAFLFKAAIVTGIGFGIFTLAKKIIHKMKQYNR